MRRTARKHEPNLPPVRRIELPDKYPKWRLILLIVLLVGGLALIVTAAVRALTSAPGWQTITVDSVKEENCGGDFTLQYLLGQTEQPANLENNSIVEIYTQAAVDAYRLFNSQESFENVHNLHYLSSHVGEEAEVDPALYNVFSQFEKAGSRALYLAPVYEIYRTLFSSSDDDFAAMSDPFRNEETREYIRQVLLFVSDPEHISLELLNENRVRLTVSKEYEAFFEANEITAYLDLYWMQNAFIADFLAEKLIAAGHTNGVLSSYDGFTRNLDASSRSYKLNLFDRVGDDVFSAAVMEYSGVKTLISLRNYPTHQLNAYLYYRWESGELYSCFVDPADGLSKTAVNDLTVWSRSLGCGETLLAAAKAYIVEELDTSALQSLPGQGIEYAVFQDRRLYLSDSAVTVGEYYEKDGVRYDRGEWE